MRVLVTGATGYIGSAVVHALLNGVNEVTGTGRDERRAAALMSRGMKFQPAELTNLGLLERLAGDHEIVIHAAQAPSDPGGQVDAAATAALLSGAASGRTEVFVYTSGLWVLGATGEAWATDDTPVNPPPRSAWRAALEPQVRASASPRLRTAIIRPAIVYGGQGGIFGMWLEDAVAGRPIRVVGDGGYRWATVHRDDLANLYLRVIDAGQPGAIYNASDETAHTALELAEALAVAAGGVKVERWPLAEARQALGEFADSMTMSQRVKSPAARKLGWQLRHPDPLNELDRVYDEYVAQAPES